MNQPTNPTPPRSARPQLFSAPADKPSKTKRQADFGPSILATIDGSQTTSSGARRASSRGGLWGGVLAVFLIATAYGAVQLNESRVSPLSAVTAVKLPEIPVVSKPVEPVASAPTQSSLAEPAVIETVAAVPALPAVVPAASSVGRQDTGTGTDTSVAKKPESIPPKLSLKTRVAAAPRESKPLAKVSSPDTDADLLAAMLPHLKRQGGMPPTSAAYERRCGQLSGDASASCRARFCNGRQGEDAACPAVAPAAR